MHHLYPSGKGDPLCPLGFHPQVRWPTRCKRCFRDYKEHGGRKKTDDNALRKDDTTSSSPSLSLWSSSRKNENSDVSKRNWTSVTNVSRDEKDGKSDVTNFSINRPASWASTPTLEKLDDDTQANIPTVNITLPRRKTAPLELNSNTTSSSSTANKICEKSSVINKNDNLSTRAKKLKTVKETSAIKMDNSVRRIQVKELKSAIEEPTNHDIQFLIQVKSRTFNELEKRKEEKRTDDDTASIAGTETTDTTLVDRNEYDFQEQIETLKKELESMKIRCEKAERGKCDILLRRLAAKETTTSKTTASEVLKLQQRCNELHTQLEDLQDNNKCLNLKVKELEIDLDVRPTPQLVQKVTDELKSKLLAAETLCEELMDENEDMKKELREMEDEMEEMQDNFREDQADEYSSLRKELEQTTKNCRILSFKLRKTERKVEQMDAEKQEVERKLKEVSDGQSVLEKVEHIKQLEKELSTSNETSQRLQKQLDELNSKMNLTEESNKKLVKKKAPKLSAIGKAMSSEGKISRESLTRGGSQEDPVQLLRDLQDSLEREADLREQLKFAEEEAQNLRKKVSRIEDDNESLALQLKKMATSKGRSRKLSPNPSLDKESNIDDENPTELRLLLELSEQEASVLRRKVEELEMEADTMKRKLNDVHDKLGAKMINRNGKITEKTNQDQKIKDLENEISDLRKKLQEKEKNSERLNAELNIIQRKPNSLQKSNSLNNDQSSLNIRHQLQVTEQEAVVLRAKLQSLETENEKLVQENKRLALLKGTKKIQIDKINSDKKLEKKKLDDTNILLKSKKSEDGDKKGIDIEELKKQIVLLENQLSEHKQHITNEKNKNDDLNHDLKKTNESVNKLEDEKLQLKGDYEKVVKEKNKLEQQLQKFSAKLEVTEMKQALAQKAESLQLEVNEKQKEINSLKTDLHNMKQLEQEKIKLNKQLLEKTGTVSKLEDLFKQTEDKLKKSEKSINSMQDKVTQLEQEVDIEKHKLKEKEVEWIMKRNTLEADLKAKDSKIAEMNRRESTVPSTLADLQEKLNRNKTDLVEMKNKYEETLTLKSVLEERLQKLESQLKTEKLNSKNKISELESELQLERKRADRIKATHDKEQNSMELELSTLKTKIYSLEQKSDGSNEKLSSLKKDYENRLLELQKKLIAENKKHEELTAKYEILEEEHVVTKAQLIMEKEKVNSELTNVRKTYNNEHDKWIKEKLSFEEQLKELKQKSRAGNNASDLLERARLKSALEERTTEIEQTQRKNEVLEDQLKNIRKDNEDLKQKLDDFDKVSKIQRNFNADSSALENELVQSKSKISQVEKNRKVDLAECKMRYESQLSVINDELRSVQNQITRFKRERDMYKHMLEGAQKELGELKLNTAKSERVRHHSISSHDEMEESRTKIATLEQQISCMEDELSEARLESSKLKTELVSERSSWEVKLLETRSKINELEEDRLLSSGRTKTAGLRTRMELAWHKEREEQTRLLQETSTLARDLRQTLFEVERERDKERLEAKRKHEQLKKTSDEDQEENRKKLNELECDLLELRDAHAKLRTTNEKLRREKEKNERDRDELRTMVNYRKKTETDSDRRMNILLEQVEILMRKISDLSINISTPIPTKRTKPISRESSPSTTEYKRETLNVPDNRAEIQTIVQRLEGVAYEIRQIRGRSTASMRRAASTEHETVEPSRNFHNNHSKNVQLHRKSLSLEQTADQFEQNIWITDNDSTSSSIQNLESSSNFDPKYYSMDSRLSGGSTQSEIISGDPDKKKRKGFIGKIKKLTKSRSTDEPNYQSQSDSEDVRGSKKDLKERLTEIFKRGGSSSRSNSVERNRIKDDKQDSSSILRPLMHNKNNNNNSPIYRLSPSPSDKSASLHRKNNNKY